MITVDDKIKTFSKYVYDKEIKVSNEKLKEIELSNKEVLCVKKKEISEQSELLRIKMNKKIELDSQKIIASAKRLAKADILRTEKNILHSFTEELYHSLLEYSKTESYNDLLKKIFESSKDLLVGENVKVYLTGKDCNRFREDLKKNYKGIEIVIMDDKNIGGTIIESTSSRERVDLTLKRKLHDWTREIGIRLYEAIKK